ncbi:MAG TPA: hypothetical protein VFE58_04750 [Tepidisphaeraceae bacterium]|jgi:hypothetical protein|nr:hypothetical protein [Tepidisphaeraceae bacterium]
MKTLLDQLDRDSILVLYAAEELSSDDQNRADAMLRADPQMRADLEALRASMIQTDAALQHADQTQRLPVDPRIMQRHVSRMIHQWQFTRPDAPPTMAQKVVGLKFPWWSYPATAAAAIFLAFLVWWGNTPMHSDLGAVADSSQVQQQLQVDDQPAPDDNQQIADELEQSFKHPSHEGLRKAEGELYALSRADEADEGQQQELSQ